MAKEDFCFTYYDGDAARDMAHMNRLQRGAYIDFVSAQRKRGHLTENDIKRVLGSDFEACWEALEWILKKDDEGKFFIEWVENSVKNSKVNAQKNKEKIEQYWADVAAGKIPKPKNGRKKHQFNTEEIPEYLNGNKKEIPLGNGNEDEDEIIENEEKGGEGEKTQNDGPNLQIAINNHLLDVDLLLEKVIRNQDFQYAYVSKGLDVELVERWLTAYNRFLKFKGEKHCIESSYCFGFSGWLAKRDVLNSQPEDYTPVKDFNNATNSQTHTASAKPSTGAEQLAAQLLQRANG